MDKIREFLPSILTFISLLTGGAFGYGKLNQKVCDMGKRVDKVEKNQNDDIKEIRKALQDQNEFKTQVLTQLARIEGHMEGYKEGKEQRKTG